MAQNALIRDPVPDKLHQPFMINGVKVSTNIRVQNPAYLTGHYSGIQRIQRMVWTAPRTKPVGESHKALLVDGVEHTRRGPLHDLVFQRGYSQRPLSPIRLRDPGPFHRFGPIGPSLQPPRKIRQVFFQIFSIPAPRPPVHPRRGVSFNRVIRLLEVIRVVYVVPQTGKLHPSVPTSSLSYPLHRIWQVHTSTTFSDSEFGTCFVAAISPWPGPFPPQSPPPGITPGFVRLLLWYYGPVRLPTSVHRGRAPLGFSARSSPSLCTRPNVGSPGSRAKSFRACPGSPTTRGRCNSRDSKLHRVAFRRLRTRRRPGVNLFSRLNTWPTLSPVNASVVTSRSPPHDSGSSWLAKPSTYGTFIHYSLPVCTGAPQVRCLYVKQIVSV